jgi:hypothetical protein
MHFQNGPIGQDPKPPNISLLQEKINSCTEDKFMHCSQGQILGMQANAEAAALPCSTTETVGLLLALYISRAGLRLQVHHSSAEGINTSCFPNSPNGILNWT